MLVQETHSKAIDNCCAVFVLNKYGNKVLSAK